MSWQGFRWIWRVETPLFLGMPPAEALNRCRPYVPGRVLWGALTAELARRRNRESFPNYREVGETVVRDCRPTYLFPAEEQERDFVAWLPKFDEGGLQWCRERAKESCSDREFRRRLFDTRPSTAIDPASDSASEGTLRETECIAPWWRGQRNEPSPVFLSGYVFLREEACLQEIEAVDTLLIGGDTRYGLGRIRREKWQALSRDPSIFGRSFSLDKTDPEIMSDVVYGHAPVDALSRGQKELLGGWDFDSPKQRTLHWVPGSCVSDGAKAWSLDAYGCWHSGRTPKE